MFLLGSYIETKLGGRAYVTVASKHLQDQLQARVDDFNAETGYSIEVLNVSQIASIPTNGPKIYMLLDEADQTLNAGMAYYRQSGALGGMWEFY